MNLVKALARSFPHFRKIDASSHLLRSKKELWQTGQHMANLRKYTNQQRGEAPAVLQLCNWNAVEASQKTGLPLRTIARWAKEYGPGMEDPLTKSRVGNKIALNDANTETIQRLSVPSSV